MLGDNVAVTGGPRLRTVSSYELVGQRLRELRDQNHLSIPDLVVLLTVDSRQDEQVSQVTAEYLQGLERGVMAPYPEHIPYLERALQCTPGEIHHMYGYLASNETPPIGEDYVTFEEACELLEMPKGSVHGAIKRGVLQARRLMPPPGRSQLILLVRRADLAKY